MYVIGVTGGIGSGKTTVAEMLREKGAAIVNADLAGHEVYLPGRPAWQEIVDAFGKEVIAPDGTIDRRKLGPIVFSDPKRLERLNAITHPRIKELMREKLTALADEGVPVVVLEAALLFDAQWEDLADEVWVTVVSPEVAAQRAVERSGITVEQALARVKAQMSNEERTSRADVIISTDCPLEETRAAVDGEWARLRERLGKRGAHSPKAKSAVETD